GVLEIVLQSQFAPTLYEISFTIKNGVGLNFTLTIFVENGNLIVEQHQIREDPFTFSKKYMSYFDKITITTTATISLLSLVVCYEPEETITSTPFETTTPQEEVCPDGFSVLKPEFFGTGADNIFTPSRDPSSIEFEVKVTDKRVQQINVTSVTLKLYGILTVYVILTYKDGVTINNKFNVESEIVTYFPENGVEIQSIFFQLEVDENSQKYASAQYLNATGCIEVANCTLGYCKDVCLDTITDLCYSQCPPEYCFTTPTTTTSTIATPTQSTPSTQSTSESSRTPIFSSTTTLETRSTISLTSTQSASSTPGTTVMPGQTEYTLRPTPPVSPNIPVSSSTPTEITTSAPLETTTPQVTTPSTTTSTIATPPQSTPSTQSTSESPTTPIFSSTTTLGSTQSTTPPQSPNIPESSSTPRSTVTTSTTFETTTPKGTTATTTTSTIITPPEGTPGSPSTQGSISTPGSPSTPESLSTPGSPSTPESTPGSPSTPG
ncbi:unnamed protein product, partial [Lymnaea stagnalis]